MHTGVLYTLCKYHILSHFIHLYCCKRLNVSQKAIIPQVFCPCGCNVSKVRLEPVFQCRDPVTNISELNLK